jgi:hypothetical protein
MQRNWDTIRKILLKIEALPTEGSTLDSGEIDGMDSETACYHMRLMIEAGLIKGNCRDLLGPPHCFALRLTWEGHEFIDGIRRESVWNRVKAISRERGIDLAFDTIKAIAAKVAQGLLG